MNKQLPLVSTVFAISLLSACGGSGGSDDNVDSNTLATQTDPSQNTPGADQKPIPTPLPDFFADNTTLKVLNTSYDSPSTNVMINEQTIKDLENVKIQEVSSSVFRPANTNSITLQSKLPEEDAINIVDPMSLDLTPDTENTLVAFGPVNVMQHVVMTYDKKQALPANKSQLQVLHGSFIGNDIARGDLDVYITSPDIEELSNVTASLKYGEYNPDIKIEPGSARIRVTSKDDPSNILFDTGNSGLSFDTGRVHKVVLADDISTANSAINVIVTNNNGSSVYLDKSASVYFKVVHLLNNAPSSSSGAIEFHNTNADQEPSELFSSLQYNNTEPANEGLFAGLPEGDYQFSASPDTNSSDDIFFSAPKIRFKKGELYTLILSGDASQPQPDVHLIHTSDDIRPVSGFSQIKVINAALSLNSIDVYIAPAGSVSVQSIENKTAGKANFSRINFTRDGGYTRFTPGSYDIHIVENDKVIASRENVTLNERSNASLIAYDETNSTVNTLIVNQSSLNPIE